MKINFICPHCKKYIRIAYQLHIAECIKKPKCLHEKPDDKCDYCIDWYYCR